MAALGRAPRPKRAPVECGDLPFVIQRDGTWLYRGTPIGRKELVCLFAGVLKREADGSFWLETPAERGRIQVEDAPFVAVELDWTGDGRHQILSLRTNVDQVVTAGPEHPIRIAHDILTCEPTRKFASARGPVNSGWKRGSVARCTTSWWRSRSPNGSRAGGCWAYGRAGCFSHWARCRPVRIEPHEVDSAELRRRLNCVVRAEDRAG